MENNRLENDDLIRSTYDRVVKSLSEKLVACSWNDSKFYLAWLSQTYFFVSHSTSLLAAAASRIKEREIKDRFFEHISEEKGHETLAKKDIEQLGYSLGDCAEMSVTEAFYQSQYFKVEHQDALSLLGYILCLEGLAVEAGPTVLERLRAIYPTDHKHLFMKVHAEEDPGHLTEAFAQVEKLDARVIELIQQNLTYTAEIYSLMLDRCEIWAKG